VRRTERLGIFSMNRLNRIAMPQQFANFINGEWVESPEVSPNINRRSNFDRGRVASIC